MEDQLIPELLFKYNPAGERDPGRPDKRLKDCFLFSQYFVSKHSTFVEGKFGLENLEERDYQEDLGVDGRIILEYEI
jgi:hypothetical protein